LKNELKKRIKKELKKELKKRIKKELKIEPIFTWSSLRTTGSFTSFSRIFLRRHNSAECRLTTKTEVQRWWGDRTVDGLRKVLMRR
jgi:hypothetical protein